MSKAKFRIEIYCNDKLISTRFSNAMHRYLLIRARQELVKRFWATHLLILDNDSEQLLYRIGQQTKVSF